MPNRRSALKLLSSVPFVLDAFGQTASAQHVQAGNSRLQAWTDKQQRELGLPGLWVAVARDGIEAATVVAGKRNQTKGELAVVADKLMIGSISKPMTGFLAGALVEQGKLGWQTTVAQVLPNVARSYPQHPAIHATVVHLLCHRSGLCAPVSFDLSKYPRTPQGYRQCHVEALFGQPPAGQLGEKYVYTGGLNVLAMMAEAVTGKTYEELMRAHVFRPLGMAAAGFGPPPAPSVQPYYRNDSGEITPGDARQNTTQNVDPGGSIHCSIADVARFGMHYGTGARRGVAGVSARTIRTMLTAPFVPGTTTASLWWEGSWPGWYLHNGSTGRGEYAWFAFSPEKQLSVAVYYNLNRRDGSLRYDDLEIGFAKSVETRVFGV